MHGLTDVGLPPIVAVSINGCERGLGLLDGLHALYFVPAMLRGLADHQGTRRSAPMVMQQMGVKSAPKLSDHHISRSQLYESK